MELDSTQHVFLSGIGGVSMSGLAHALLKLGFKVSGSDIADSKAVEALRADGAQVFIGHAAENVQGADVVVRSTAVPEDGPEIVAGRQAGLPVHHRSELLAWMCRGRHGIAVTGTHGKSTTTAMLATILIELGLDPTVFVGAESELIGGNFRLGNGPHVVFEACESDGSFVNYVGCSEIITNCEADHLDQHRTFENLTEAFAKFASIADPQGYVVYNADCPTTHRVASHTPARLIPFGFGASAHVSAREVALDASGSSFVLTVGGARIAPVTLKVIGEHNVSNALAALAAAEGAGLDLEAACAALARYAAVDRRFQLIGVRNGVRVVDDYAHHPTEIRATLAAARTAHSGRIIAIFQPHLRSRTRDFLPEFGRAFSDADLVILAPIYQPREDGLADFDITCVEREIRRNEPDKPVQVVQDMHDAPGLLAGELRAGDLVLTIGAGDVYKVAGEVLEVA